MLCSAASGAPGRLRDEFILKAVFAPAWNRDGEIRIAFNRQPDGQENRLDIDPGRTRLVRVEADGSERILAENSPGPDPSLPCPVRIKHRRGRLSCLVVSDILAVQADPLRGGEAEIVLGPNPEEPLRAQPLADITFADDFMRGADGPDPWTALAGEWAPDELPNASWSSNAFRMLAKGDGDCITRAGAWFWDDLAAAVAVSPGTGCGAAGLAAGLNEEGKGVLFRWVAAAPAETPGIAHGILELVDTRNGAEHRLAARVWPLDPAQWYRLGLAVSEDRVTGFLDGEPALAARAPGLFGGGIGLYARKTPGTRFDDAAVASLPEDTKLPRDDDPRPFPATVLPRTATVVAERFRTDRYMQQWAGELGNWLPADADPRSPERRHLGFFTGDFRVEWRGEYPMPFERGPLALSAVPEDGNPENGITFRFEKTGGSLAVIRVDGTRAGRTVSVPVTGPVTAFAWGRTGGAFEVSVNGAEPVVFGDEIPDGLRGIRVRCPWYRQKVLTFYSGDHVYERAAPVPAVQDLAVSAANELDYLFHEAPVDWVADTGTWEITPRWICLPMFSWLGGRSHETAVFRHKQVFGGDLIVDVHAAVMMDYGPMSGYNRYGDLSISICGDGQNPSSGYTFQFGAEGNSVTRILKGDRVVAETTAVTYPPRSEGAHQNWYHLTAEKRGSEVRFSVDNRVVCTYADPEPLEGGSVSLWTWDRGMMVARARIFSESRGVPGPEHAIPHPEGGHLTRETDSELHVEIPECPARTYDFDGGLQGWGSAPDEHGAAVSRERRGNGAALRAENVRAGGDFRLDFPGGPFDAREYGRLSFECRPDADARLNLYFRIFDRWHFVRISGPGEGDSHTVRESRAISGRKTATSGLQLQELPPLELARVPAPPADAWSVVTVPLLHLLEQRYPGHGQYEVRDLHLGNHSNEGYLQAGFGGNRAGTRVRLDNVFLGNPTSHSVIRPVLTAPENVRGPLVWGARVDGDPAAYPLLREFTDSVGPQTLPGTGTAYFHAGYAAADGSRSGSRTCRVDIDAGAPVVAEVDPPPGPAVPGVVRFRLDDPGASGIDPRTVRVSADGNPLPLAALVLTGTPEQATLTVDLFDVPRDEGQPLELTVEATDRAGNGLAGERTFRWTHSPESDREPPTVPVLAHPSDPGWDEDFETESDEWARAPGSAWVRIATDSGAAASGQRSLLVLGGPGPYRARVRSKPFDLKARPVLEFAYRANRETTWDLILETDRGHFVVMVNGRSRRDGVVGRLENYTPDGSWHTARVPVAEWLSRRKAYDVPAVRSLAVGADGMEGGRPSELRLDAMRVIPAILASAPPVLTSRDPGGIAGYACRIAEDPADTLPEDAPTSTAMPSLREFRPGLWYIHARAADRAGNRSQAACLPVVLRNEPDEIPPGPVRVEPVDGPPTAMQGIRFRLRDEGTGISPESVRVTVNGREYRHGDSELTFRDAGSTVEWRPRRTSPGAPAFADGREVVFRVDASDYAGNPVPPMDEQSWTVDFDADTTPPPAPFLSWQPADVFIADGFEDGHGSWMGRREGWAHVEEGGAATGTRCVRFGGFSTFFCHSAFDTARFPLVGFAYRLSPGDQLNLMVRAENRNWEIRLNSDQAKYPYIGRIDGIRADGQWHFCAFDLAAMLRNAPIPPKGTVVDHIASLNKRGESFLADDFFVGGPVGETVAVSWSVPEDATGIRGYSTTRDDRPDTVPDETVDTDVPRATVSVTPGAGTWFHVRAVDGAGNAGPAAHLKVGSLR